MLAKYSTKSEYVLVSLMYGSRFMDSSEEFSFLLAMLAMVLCNLNSFRVFNYSRHVLSRRCLDQTEDLIKNRPVFTFFSISKILFFRSKLMSLLHKIPVVNGLVNGQTSVGT